MKHSLTNEEAQFLSELTIQYGDALTKYAYRFFSFQPHMRQIAEDAVQDTLLKAIHDIDIVIEHPNPIGWLKVSLRNVLLNILRDQHWAKEELQDRITESPERCLYIVLSALDQLEKYPRLSEVTRVAQLILSPGEYETYHDHFLMGLTNEEAALLEQVPESTVRGRISRIRKKIRKYFEMPCCFLFLLFYRSGRG